jgi:hypothetical protein
VLMEKEKPTPCLRSASPLLFRLLALLFKP